MAKGKSYQRYSASFKKTALTKAAEDGVTDARTCDELGVSKRQLRRWRDDLKDKIEQMSKHQARPGQLGRPRIEEPSTIYYVM